ncbi:MAG: hypothetical protein HDQ88_00935 [Clostridia bacterium]|nr:hypothetical protein [Clostridia bacterium]
MQSDHVKIVWDDITAYAMMLDLSNYISRNRCRTTREFMDCVLSDIRGGNRMGKVFYDKFFSDVAFQHDVMCFCQEFGRH